MDIGSSILGEKSLKQCDRELDVLAVRATGLGGCGGVCFNVEGFSEEDACEDEWM